MEKEIKIKQSNVVTEINKGASIQNVPSPGANLPPIKIEQTNIVARENTGLEFVPNPNSGLVKMNHTFIKSDFAQVTINPTAGDVIINPAAGSVKFSHWE